MKTKLISYDVLENIKNSSLSAAERELVEAAPLLSKALNMENLELVSFGPETALYESIDGTYVHGQYKIANGNIAFENIEQLSIDTDTEKEQGRKTLELLVDAILENKNEEAGTHFDSYINIPSVKRSFKENFNFKKKDKKAKCSKCSMMKKGSGKKAKQVKDVFAFGKKAGKKLKEWAYVAKNAIDYIDYQKYGPQLKECVVEYDSKNEAAKVEMPVSFGRNAMKMRTFDWKVLDANYKLARTTAKLASENMDFCKAVADLKRNNAMSDNQALEESLENIVGNFPDIIFLTEEELAGQIKSALQTVRATNFDDKTCLFMAEGILRTAHQAFTDKVNKILTLAGVKLEDESKDQYEEFKSVADSFYPRLDESSVKEMQMFVDLYEALKSAYAVAESVGDEVVRSETASHLNELLAIVQQQVQPDLEVAQAASEWLDHLTESGMAVWDVTNKAYVTTSGEHPHMAELGKTSPIMPGEYGDEAPSSDGKNVNKANAEKMRVSWGNVGGPDTWPNLTNPYIIQPFGDFTMKGEKGVDKDLGDVLDKNQKDTWPDLQNPYVPTGPEVDRMKSDDLVVDK